MTEGEPKWFPPAPNQLERLDERHRECLLKGLDLDKVHLIERKAVIVELGKKRPQNPPRR